MIQQANTVGLFQIESRAQMSMLPRLKPACFYDLVIQIAIVRPGPIQGDMVHPFLRRRAGLEAISYPSQELEQVLGRTMGVPIFQEQVIKLAMVAAGFSGGEADQLRRAMASWKKTGELEQFRPKLLQGMLARGYSLSYAEQIFQQICGFGEYGFPESHSASFALLAYASAWLKYYYPLEFFVSLLNSLPMGFYSASQLVQDAKRQGIVVLPVCIQHSALEHKIEQLPAPQAEYQIPGQLEQQAEVTLSQQSRHKGVQRALRLGLTLVKGLQPQKILHTLALRPTAGFPSLTALKQTALSQADLDKLASADALLALCGHRYASRWQLQDTLEDLPLFAGYTATDITIQNDSSTQSGSNRQSDSNKAACPLPAPSAIAALVEDYRQLGLSLKQHPMALLRQAALLPRTCKAADLPKLANQLPVQVAGVVTCRQSPGTAGGVTFMTLEDETGMVNVVVWRAIAQRDKTAFLTSRLLMVAGQLQRSGEVIHIIAGQLQSIDKLLPELAAASRDFH
jgi:error-prone DNA polymerase